jgi:hypothetical protein
VIQLFYFVSGTELPRISEETMIARNMEERPIISPHGSIWFRMAKYIIIADKPSFPKYDINSAAGSFFS